MTLTKPSGRGWIAGFGGSSIVPSASPTSTERASSAASAGARQQLGDLGVAQPARLRGGHGALVVACERTSAASSRARAATRARKRLGLEQDRLAEIAAQLGAEPALGAVGHRRERGAVGEAARVGAALELPARDVAPRTTPRPCRRGRRARRRRARSRSRGARTSRRARCASRMRSTRNVRSPSRVRSQVSQYQSPRTPRR